MQRRQRGQSMTEYVIACGVLAFVLFVPIAGDAASPGGAKTTVELMLDGFKRAYQKFSYALSLPT
jgi:hypothetical protein